MFGAWWGLLVEKAFLKERKTNGFFQSFGESWQKRVYEALERASGHTNIARGSLTKFSWNASNLCLVEQWGITKDFLWIRTLRAVHCNKLNDGKHAPFSSPVLHIHVLRISARFSQMFVSDSWMSSWYQYTFPGESSSSKKRDSISMVGDWHGHYGHKTKFRHL